MTAPRRASIEPSPAGARVHRLPSGDEVPDEALVRRALEGDAWAKEAIYRRHVHRVMGVATRLLRNRNDAEDVVQDTFVVGFRDLAALREPSRVGSWLVGSAVHRIQKLFRRRRLQRLLGLDRSLDEETLADQAHADASQEARAELGRLDVALRAASDDDRATWVLRHLFGYSLPEVASLTRCSLATVNRRVGRAQAIVDRAFGSDEDA